MTSEPTPDPARPVVVLDTSALVNDPAALLSYPTADVVVPLVVVEELDGHKARPDEVGRAAREAIRTLERMRVEAGGSLASGLGLPGGGSVRIELNGLATERLSDLGLDVSTGDNRLLAAALGLSECGPVTVVSADAAARLKAGQLGLTATDHVRTRSEAVDLSGPGWATVEVPAAALEVLYADRDVPAAGTFGALLDQLPSHTGLVLRAGTSSALARLVPSAAGMSVRLLPAPRSPWGMRPKNKEQRFALELLLDPDVTVVGLAGPSGTGKTMLCLAAALEQVFEPESAAYDRVMVIRPLTTVGRQEVGFLPGDLSAKIGPHYEAIVDCLVALGDQVTHRQARDILDGWVHAERMVMEPVSFLRGRSLHGTYIIVDEAQNLSPEVLKTILTRVGEGSKVVLTGDVTQQDAPYLSETNNALSVLVDRFRDEPMFGHLHLRSGVRSLLAERAAELL